MPYEVVHKGNWWLVIKEADGRVMGKHQTREKALAQMRALYAAEKRGPRPR